MKNHLLFFLIFKLCCFSLFSQSNNYNDHQLFLLANLENLEPNGPELKSLENEIAKQKDEFTILVLGDFTPKKKWKKIKDNKTFPVIDKIMEMAKDNGHVIFVPGEKEWDMGRDDAYKKVKAIEKYVEAKEGKHKSFFPENGCPGPEVVDINNHLRLIIINSQWFVQKDRPEEEDASCHFIYGRELWDELSGLFSEEENKTTVVAFHHPALSFGKFAGHTNFLQHLSPPIIGSFIAAYHRNVGGKMSLNNEIFKDFTHKVLDLAGEHQGLIFVSGHEYDLQLIDHNNSFYINSGSFSKSNHVASKEETLFASSSNGFAKLGFAGSGAVDVDFYKIKSDGNSQNIFHKDLYSSPCENQVSNISPNPLFSPCLQKEEIDYANIKRTLPSIGSAVPEASYQKGSLGKFFLGKYYRDVWAAPVTDIPYLDIVNYEGGLYPYAEGGAGESTSLKFKTKDGRKFSFRSVDKDPQRRLPQELQNTTVSSINKDMIASQHPFGPMVASVLLDKLGLPHSDPQLFIMPDDPALGEHRETFKEMLGTLEIKPVGKKGDRAGYNGADKVHGTFQMYRKILDDSKNKLEVDGYVRARLFDIWMADWDRHEDQWKWLGYETEDGGLNYKVFPKDKDKVFAILDGLYSIMDWESMSPTIGTFRDDYKGLETLNFKSRNMDRWLANGFTREQWMAAVDEFVKLMDDKTIEEALSNMPPAAYELSAERIRNGMKIRRERLPEAIGKYYEMLAKYVDIPGTNERERFLVDRKTNGDVEITILQINKEGEVQGTFYNRLFKKDETKEIRLYGLGKQDEFIVEGSANQSILVRIIGGKGSDSITDRSNVKGSKKMTTIFDIQKKDDVDYGVEAKEVKSYEEVKFDSQNLFNYDYFSLFPQLGYNSDDGFLIGLGLSKLKRSFATREFAVKTRFSGAITTTYNFNFFFEQIRRTPRSLWDFVYGIEGARNDVFFQRFYGLGNNTEIDDDLDSEEFYRNNLSIARSHIGLSRQFWGKSLFQTTLNLEYIDVGSRPLNENSESIYDNLPAELGVGESFLAGPEVNLVMDLTDNPYLPTRGIKFKLYSFGFYNTNENIDFGGRVDTELSTHLSIGNTKPVTLSLRGGYSQTFGDNPFYYKSTLGQQSNHRGYNRNRFVGDRAAFMNSNLRFHLGSIHTPFVPLKYGIYGLYDLGRVWIDGEDSDDWHTAYGGGFYFMPFQEQFNINLVYARNEEGDSIISVRFGFFVN